MDLSQRKLLILLFLKFVSEVSSCNIPESEKFECGYNIESKKRCESINCCYNDSLQDSTPKCYFPSKDAAGSPIQHSNGLCVYPKDGRTEDGTLLIWSSKCHNRNAVFLVSNDYPTYHIASGQCILPRSGKPSDPGDNGEIYLGNNYQCTNNYLKFKIADNGNLEYYTRQSLDVCIGGFDSSEPEENESVKLPKTLCIRKENCQHLTYVYQYKFKQSKKKRTINCSTDYAIQVTWANYGVLHGKGIPAVFDPEKTECTKKNITNIMQEKCNGYTRCCFEDKTFLATTSCATRKVKYLIVRYACKRITRPDAPTSVSVHAVSPTKLRVTWKSKPGRDEDPINGYSICWKTLTKEGNCKIVNVSSSIAQLDNLEPSTKYFINVASHSCDGGIGNFSKTQTAITRAVAPRLSGNVVSHNSFEIVLDKLKYYDSYVLIFVMKYSIKELPTKLYIAAELNKIYVNTHQNFTVGDGKKYGQFNNAKLEPESFYSVFQRIFRTDGAQYKSSWMNVVKTGPAPATSMDTIKDVIYPNGTTSSIMQPIGREEKDGDDDDGGEEDVDECENKNICPRGSTCVNVFGSYTCECNEGYSKDETNVCIKDLDPRSCAEWFKKGARRDGVYKINPDGRGAFEVKCDMTTDGGGWTVFQRRVDGSENFYRNWADYKNGFGIFNGEFWLGLEKIHRMTTNERNVLRVDLESFQNEKRYAEYRTFAVSDERNQYRLSVGRFQRYSNAGDSLSYHNRMKFSTKDRQNDEDSRRNCAQVFSAAWWYRACHYSSLNGLYYHSGPHTSLRGKGVSWYGWKGFQYSLKESELKIRPRWR